MKYDVIATGSSGNAVLIEENLLVDCGIPYKALMPYCGSIKLVLFTHAHSDHFKNSTVRALAKNYPKLRFGCGDWMAEQVQSCQVDPERIDVLKKGVIYDYGLCQIVPVPLTHNVPVYGYRIYFPNGRVFYATDTGNLDGISAPGYDLYLVEANHTEADIQDRIRRKQEAGLFSYEVQAAVNHLSKEKCDAFLYENMGNNSEYVYLHQHKDGDGHADHCADPGI